MSKSCSLHTPQKQTNSMPLVPLSYTTHLLGYPKRMLLGAGQPPDTGEAGSLTAVGHTLPS